MRLTIVLFSLCLISTVAAAEPYDFRISVDTGPNHLRNKAIERFTKLLGQRTEAIRPRLYPSGQLSKDRDIPKALHWGYVDMGVVARLKLTPFVVDMNLASIPSIYGLSVEHYHHLLDGEIGQRLNNKLQQLGVRVLGSPIDLGFVNSYTSKQQIQRTEDYQGLKLRVTGGNGLLELFKTFGVNAVLLPFSDVPLALLQGSLDGLQTTHETVASAELWEFGLKYCYEDKASFIDYIPIVSQHFWDKLTPELQALLVKTWNDAMADSRPFALRRQAEARMKIIQQGIVCTQPSPSALRQERQKLIPVGEALVQRLGMDLTLYQDAMRIISSLD